MDDAAAISGIVSIIILIFGFILALLTLLMPFFIYKIRNEVIELNQKLSSILSMMNRAINQNTPPEDLPALVSNEKRCPHCQTVNHKQGHNCINCGQRI